MRFRRGTPPVLYDLFQGEAPIGAITRSDHGEIMFSLHGFHSADAAASAAWAAHSGRVAYGAQFAGATPATHREVADTLRLLLVTLRRPEGAAAIPRLVPQEAPGVLHLQLGEEQIGEISETAVDEGPTLWTMTVPIGADAPAVFTMAAARRMWAAVRGAGLWSRMAQWNVRSQDNHSRRENAQWQRT